MESVPRGKVIWNANGGFVLVLLTHLLNFFIFIVCSRVAFCQPSINPRLDWIGLDWVTNTSPFALTSEWRVTIIKIKTNNIHNRCSGRDVQSAMVGSYFFGW